MAAAARDSGTDLLREPPLRELQAWPLRRFESAPAPRPERARRAWFARGNGHGHGKGKRHKRH
jgi:hypothetical protein